MSIKLDYMSSHAPKGNIPNPPGYLPPASSKELAKTATITASPDQVALQARRSTDLKMKRAWDLALAPAKGLPMQAIMLYFSGSGVQIFSLGVIFMLLTSPISAVFNILKAFEAFRPTPPATLRDGKVERPSYMPLLLPMLAYVGCQALVLSLGLYKCSSMGILPTGSADWLQFETRNEPPEWSAIRAASLG